MTMLSAADWSAVPAPFVALWTDATLAYALYEPGRVVTTGLRENSYPALSPRFPAAAWFERLAHDLNGAVATGAVDARPAVEQFRAPDGAGAWPAFSAPDVAGVHQLGLGPVRPGIGAPAHLRASLSGERLLRLEARLGYAHRGILALIRGKSARLAARFAARVGGDATVAHALAFAQAAETALGVQAPPRAVFLRGAMAELERLAGHAGAIAELAEGAGAARLAAGCAARRETLCVAAEAAFGHRLMMDVVIPGGVSGDLRSGGAAAILAALEEVEAALPGWRRLAGRAGLEGAGVIAPELAAAYNAGGVAGRAAGGAADARLHPGYPPYDQLRPQPASASAGDDAARLRLRLDEMAASIGLVRNLLRALPDGIIARAPPAGSGSGLGVAESVRGAVWYWLSIGGGLIDNVFIADPSAWLWPLLEGAAAGSGLAGLALLQASLNPACGGIDL